MSDQPTRQMTEAEAAEGARILGQGAIDALKKALFSIGASCGECGRPTYIEIPEGPTPPTYEYAMATARFEDGRPTIAVTKAFACAREDCEGREKFENHRDVIAAREIPTWKPMVPPPPGEESPEAKPAFGKPDFPEPEGADPSEGIPQES